MRGGRALRPAAAAAVALTVWAAGCRDRGEPRLPPLAHTQVSTEALAAAALDALERGDVEQLTRLALTADEFHRSVWPELPSSRPEVGLPATYAWAELRQKSTAYLASLVERHRGRHFELREVTFAGESTRYPSFSVHRKAIVHVTDPSGATSALRIFGSVIERDGGFKIFSFVID